MKPQAILDAVIDGLPPRGYAVLTALCMGAIIYFGSQPGSSFPKTPWLPPHFDKVIHFIMYAGLAALAYRAIYPSNPTHRPNWSRGWVLMLALPLAVGLFDEYVQGLTPGRQQSLADIAADFLGGAVTCAFAMQSRARAARAIRRRRRELMNQG